MEDSRKVNVSFRKPKQYPVYIVAIIMIGVVFWIFSPVFLAELLLVMSFLVIR